MFHQERQSLECKGVSVGAVLSKQIDPFSFELISITLCIRTDYSIKIVVPNKTNTFFFFF